MGAGMGHGAPALARRHSWHGLLHATEQEAPMILQPQHREAAAGLVGPEISDDSNRRQQFIPAISARHFSDTLREQPTG